MIGAPPGYVGYDEGGQLTEAVRRRPYSVILFDEIEKAHPDVFNSLLQILDEGRMTDGQGRTVDFKNTVVIMTSNIGSQYLQEGGGLGFRRHASDDLSAYEAIKTRVTEELKKAFRPEFLNRIDEIIVFEPLSQDQLKQIVEIQLEYLKKRLADRKITIELTDAAKEKIAAEGYDPVYGARPLKRVIQRRIQDPMALKVLEGEIHDGDHVLVDTKDGEMTFSPSPSPVEAEEPVAVEA